MAYSECIPTRLNPLAERACFFQVVSIPGSPTMRWHRDDRELFPRAIVGEEKHLPVHGTIVYIPLIDLSPEKGSVEFAFGTQVRKTPTSAFSSCIPTGMHGQLASFGPT